MSLSVSFLEKHFKYDPVTGHVYRRTPTLKERAGQITGSVNGHGYLVTRIQGRQILCHILAWILYYKQIPTHIVDHKNHDRQDNRILNLRKLSFKKNIQNQKKRKNGTLSKYRGVTYKNRKNPWIARIRVNGELIHVGSFPTEVDAAAAWNEAALRYFGNHVKLNNLNPD